MKKLSKEQKLLQEIERCLMDYSGRNKCSCEEMVRKTLEVERGKAFKAGCRLGKKVGRKND